MIFETPQNILTPVEVVAPVVTPEAVPLPATPDSPFDKAINEIVEGGGIPLESFKGIPMVLFNDHVEVTLDKGIKRQISYQGLKELVDRSINVKELVTELEGMILPSNVFFLSQTAKELRMSCYYPGGNRDMLFNEDKMHIVAPNIIISHVLRREAKDWIVSSTYYTCTDLPISKLPKTFIAGPQSSKGIYLLPMSNTYSEGHMCYGSNSMPARMKDNHFRMLDWYFRYLWETPFNSDLGIRAVGSSVSPSAWYHALAKQAKANKPFPYRDLTGWTEMEGAQPSESILNRR